MSIVRHQAGSRMSQVVVHNGIAYLTGQVAGDASGGAAEQTRDILATIDALLAAVGTSKAKLLTATVWLADMADFAAMNQVWDAWIDPGNPPVRAGLCSALAAPGWKVEIMVQAAK